MRDESLILQVFIEPIFSRGFFEVLNLSFFDGGLSGGGGDSTDSADDGGVVDDVVGGVSGHVLLYSGEGVVHGVLLVGHGGDMGNSGHMVGVGEGGGGNFNSLHLRHLHLDTSEGVVGVGVAVAIAIAGIAAIETAVEESGVSLGISLTLLPGSLYHSLALGSLGGSGEDRKTPWPAQPVGEGVGVGEGGGGNSLDSGEGVGVDDGGDMLHDGHDGLANGIDETVLVEVFRESLQCERAETLGCLDQVTEGGGEGASGGAGVDVGLD